MVVRLSRSSVGDEEKEALARVIDRDYLGMGTEVQFFEEELQARFGQGRHVACVSTGTAALHLALSALDIGPGDEVLVPTITFVGCFQAVSATGARPVACDVRGADVFLDTSDAERKMTSRTRAIMPVHYASCARGLDDVYSFGLANGLRIIEDATHAFGSLRDGLEVGAKGDIVCFSFDGIKNITCGEGGAIVTSDDEIARRARDGRLLGVEKDTENRFSGKRSWTFDVRHQGFRYHMSNMNAAVGRAQLKKLKRFAAQRQAIASRYRHELARLDNLTLLDLDWKDVVPHIFVVRVAANRRNSLRQYLRDHDIETGFHYQPNHQLSFFAEDCPFPVADRLAEELVTLPLHAELSDEDVSRVIGLTTDFMKK